MQVLATGLDHPWELIWGPDNFLWTTERVGKRVARINPADGTTSTVLTISDVADGSDGQQGLLGLVFGYRAVYLAYSYGPEDNLQGKIVRYSYDQAAATLRDPVDVITNLPASDDIVINTVAQRRTRSRSPVARPQPNQRRDRHQRFQARREELSRRPR